MSNLTDTNQASDSEPINQHLVCLWRLQDIEETIADASPEELVDLHPKLVALSTDMTEAVQSLIRTEKLKLLAEIGEPKLGDVVLMQPEQYAGGVIIDEWYKNRINKLEAEL